MAVPSQAQTSLNVTNYGARGDAVQFFANTTSNSTVVTTASQIPNSAIGEAIEVFGVGLQTHGVNSNGTNANGNQDLIATITNVVNGTNIYISQLAQATLTNTFSTYGHDNQTNFANAIAAASGTNTVINIPAGKYLFLCSSNGSISGNAAIILTGGGIHFVGAGTNSTILLSQGAWQLQWGGAVWRGFLFDFLAPITNDFSVSFENLTMDGGVQQGNTSIHGIIANPVDGQGWDQTHDAIVIRGGTGNEPTHQTWTNVAFAHWRGEMVKSNNGSTNGNVSIVSCVFTDGNASAINVFESLNVSNCRFDNLFIGVEYCQFYSTNASYFQNNLTTNITETTFAVDVAKGNNPPIYFENNTCYLAEGYDGFDLASGDNVYIISNQCICTDYATVLGIGTSGALGTFESSNIVFASNTIINPYIFVSLGGVETNAYEPTNNGAIEDVQVYGNTLTQPDHTVFFLQTYGWTTNIHLLNNDCSSFAENPNVPASVNIISGLYGSPFALIDTNNLYYISIYDNTGITNYISYANGSRFEIVYAFHAGTVYALTDTNANQIPPGAQILIQNDNWSSNSIPVYLNSALTSGPINVPFGQTLVASWTNGAWVNVSSTTNPLVNPAIRVSAPSLPLGTVLSGTSVTGSFTVQNVGGGTLSGTASVASPFSVVSGGSYSLSSNQSQTVTVSFNPTSAGSYSQNMTLTGGGGATVAVSGSATNAPVNPAIHVSVPSLSLGTVLGGTSVTGSFTVQNVGGGILSGAASVGSPFTIVSGGTYNLGSNQSQTVSVSFNPISAGSYNQTVTLTGGGGASVGVSGSATNAPVNPVIHVTPGSIAYGTVLSGTSVTNIFTVQNVGGGTLSGTASVGVPFSILSGGSYSLGSNQSQIVTVVFGPNVASNYNQNVTFTGGGGTNTTVAGSATNAPVNPAIRVTPGSVAYGTLLVGTSKTNSFTVQNVGGGTLSGTASVGVPFSILSGGSYNLGSNQSQTVTVVFSPNVASNYNQSVTFTGGGGTNTTVTGSATNAPPILPTVSGINENATDVDLSLPGLQIYAGTTVQFSATATNAQTWQWSYAVNGGTPVVWTNGTSPITNMSCYFDTNTIGNSYVWTLVVSNSQGWAESQTNLEVEAQPLGTTNTGLIFTATNGVLSGMLMANTIINGVASSYIYLPPPAPGYIRSGTAVFNFTVANAGNYEIQALVDAPNTSANSFAVNIDAAPQDPAMIWDILPITSGFEQRIVSWRGSGTQNNDQIVPKVFGLSAGAHQIRFKGEEPGTALASFTLLQVIPSPPPPPITPDGLRIISSGS